MKLGGGWVAHRRETGNHYMARPAEARGSVHGASDFSAQPETEDH